MATTTTVKLNDSGRRAGSVGELRDVYKLGSYDPEIEYLIEIATIEGETERGLVSAPVRSVARIGLVFYFASDLRFLNYPGAECVFPTDNKLDLQYQAGIDHKTTAQLVFDGYPVKRSRARLLQKDALAELADWASMQGDRWEFPEIIVELLLMNKGE
jgi:hypothetical protein